MAGRRAGTLIGLLVVVAAAIVCVPFAPTNFGGHTTYVTTHGTSMVPRFHSGDLAVVQPASSYRVGEIAAYRSPTLGGATVLHRIIAVQDGQYTFKGDNNPFVDPDRPTIHQIVGRLRFRIPHGGAVRSWLARPFVLFPLLALAIGGAGSTFVQTKRRRRRRSTTIPAPAPAAVVASSPRRRLRVVVPLAATIAAVGYLLAAVAVWNLPATQATTHRAKYTQNLTAGYSATAPRGAAYPNGKITTGQTLFTHLVKRVNFGFAYDFHGDAAHHVRGTYDVVANISSVTGWQRSLVLRPPRHFSGDHLRGSTTLDFGPLRKLESQFLAETGLDATQATIFIEPNVRITGDVEGARISNDITSKLAFQLSSIAMIPHLPTSAAGTDGPNAAKGSGVDVVTTGPRELALWKLRVPVNAARVALLAAFALGLAAFAGVLASDRRRRETGEIGAITRRYGRLLVAADALPLADERTMVRVDSMRSLVRIAHLHEQLIVHANTQGGDRFVVYTETGAYSYRAAPAAGRASQSASTAA